MILLQETDNNCPLNRYNDYRYLISRSIGKGTAIVVIGNRHNLIQFIKM